MHAPAFRMSNVRATVAARVPTHTNPRETTMQIKRTAGALGAELQGLNLATGLTPAVAAEIRQALLAHQVIFIKNQALTPAQFLQFAQAMGEPVEYPFVKGLQGFPTIIEVKKLEHEKHNFGGVWHSDTTYLAEPPMGSMLLSREVPPYGGDTLFASQYAAYEALSPTMQRLLEPLMGVSSSAKADVSKTREDRIKSDGKQEAPKDYRAEHPVVRTHPETGRKALFVNVAHTSGIVGMTEEESAPLLRFLFEHQIRPEFTCRFQWEPHAIAFWDNRCVQHNPVNDYHGHRRVMHRITLRGDKPV
ncbi:alpha-ketoglutarate-dependent taurine dioxygenase [Pseudorhodoferax aquiterrae]|uniref:Alpha-ketoglutarate-dependent taurine dioxygenase n=2 Tax=Pseudorhodoferax aquiterrae TaxID=747304 RepID=A0ABQ3FUM7_9BURK|nr:alpha-ketoglutarate-dependent taurine dioxygenase [Pseudorhodoferax aquiterrae]